MVKVGIIGGSGLEDPRICQDEKEVILATPYGQPSLPLFTGKIEGVPVVILPRHGKEHTIPPTQVNYRANTWALKDQGCTHILATTACGSLREEIKRGDFIILDQFIDFTRHRPITFFEKFEPGDLKHTAMADPFSETLRQILIRNARRLGLPVHETGTVITIEGPRFSTRAESRMFRLWGADVINMSVAPEAILANEAGLPYAVVAVSTDYDCWKTDEKPVSWEEILRVFQANIEKVKSLLIMAISELASLQGNSKI
ncbi:MAG: S-methyl-5'-thioadenosine phosphorylase [Candidatus Omnitrophica bacterium]|nr:S-methyl-5'-thioadenosine phosphorylase [Candidatus Omnitrophota bacterium]